MKNSARPAFPIPSVIDPPEHRCIIIPVPDNNDHLRVFAGLIHQLGEYRHWQQEETHSATLVAQVWKKIYDGINWEGDDCMGCCPEPTNRRYTSDGVLEVSYDGGVTWQTAPQLDPRLSGIIFPPLPGPDGAEKKCVAATSAQEFLKANLIDELTSGQGYATLFDLCVILIEVLGITGVGALIAGIVAAIFTVGVVAVQAAFTSEVWADFRCILYCRIRSDGSFNVSGWQGVKSDILSNFTGVVSAILYNWVNALGVVGLTNAARSGMVASADCSACDACPPGCPDDQWIIHGTFVTSDDDSITISSILDPLGFGQQVVRYGSQDADPPPLYCCHGCNFEITAGAITASAFVHCNGVYDPISSFSDVDFRRLEVASSASTFTIKINFNPDGCP